MVARTRRLVTQSRPALVAVLAVALLGLTAGPAQVRLPRRLGGCPGDSEVPWTGCTLAPAWGAGGRRKL